MQQLLDKGILFWLIILCCMLSTSVSNPAAIVSALFAVILSAIIQYYRGKQVAQILIGCFFLLCSLFPPVLCALPLLLYDTIWEKKWWLMLFGIGAIANVAYFSLIQLFLLGGSIGLAFLLAFRSMKWEAGITTLHQRHDDATELQRQLKLRNRQLQNAQNDAILMATLQERNRIAREIHDNVGHMLTRALLQTGALCVCIKDETLLTQMNALKDTLDSAMTSIRSSVHKLHDDAILLKQTVQSCLDPLKETYRIELIYDISETVPKAIKLCLLGILKESLSNVVKHSNGDTIRIILREHPAFYQLSVTDNGTGSSIQKTGIGLETMQDRAAQVNGLIQFFPEKNSFRVFVSIPKEGNPQMQTQIHKS